ncbi:hypothetical protein DRP77_07870 [Candidatus Poribacteria bacterium]|nr:MAG: hypothetical protein DRP77_07870 [Candidatus Poribacteria bacterium]
MERYRYFDHTADLGVEIYGGTLRDLFQNAIDALVETMVDVSTVDEREGVEVEVESDSLEELFVDMLREVIFQHEVREMYFKRGELKEFEEGRRVRFTLWGEPIDLKKHSPRIHVKNVTYHNLEIKKLNGAWRARVIFDV